MSGGDPSAAGASPTMENVRFVGLDLHSATIAIAVADGNGGEPSQLCSIRETPV